MSKLNKSISEVGYITPAEYLLSENDGPSGTRYEYVNGKVYAMEDASRNHNRLSGSLFARIFSHLENSHCQVFHSNMKVGIQSDTESYFYYPDIQVSCEQEEDSYYNRTPCLIIEVLSNSSERIDRTEKLATYRQLSSLQEYVLCSQDSPNIELFRQDTNWTEEYFTSGDAITLGAIEMTINIDEVYSFLYENDK